MTIRHILGISGGKDSAALLIGNPSVTSRRSIFVVKSYHICDNYQRRIIKEKQYNQL